MIRVIFTGLVFFLFFPLPKAKGQDSISHQKVSFAANPKFDKAGGFKRFFLGEHYRKDWAQPVDIEILDLDHFAGGLTPDKLGGGKQTRSLRMKGADGNEYVLRSVNKDPSKALPESFVGTFADDILQDQISSSNPYAPIVVAELEEAAHIYHTHPKVVYVPSSERLGKFNSLFANTLCLLEERPNGNQENNPDVDYSPKVVNTEKMLENVFGDNDHRVDPISFLKARLFDMLINDWDRHEDQWVWASFKYDGNTTYKPFPRDRDQAFTKLDGVIPQMAARPWAVRKTQNFDYRIRDVNGLNMTGNYLDRNFLSSLTLEDWMIVVSELQEQLTDAVIERSVHLLPPAIFDISGNDIISKLKRRRDDLDVYAKTYYKFLAWQTDIIGSEKNELFDVVRTDTGYTHVSVYNINKQNKRGRLIFQRAFRHKETSEIRLYGLAGNDKFQVSGKAKGKASVLRIISGNGSDSVVDESVVRGWSDKTKIYDQSAYVENIGHEAHKYFSNDTLKNKFNKQVHYNLLSPKIMPGYNPDDGVYIGAGLLYKKRAFGKEPYGSIQTVWANYAFATSAYNFGYNGFFREAIGRWDLNLHVEVNAPKNVINYYGLGNETTFDKEKGQDYYRVRANNLSVTPSITKQLGRFHSANFGLGYQSVEVEQTEGRFVSDHNSKLDSGVFDKKRFVIATVGYQFNNTDNILYPTRGARFNVGLSFTDNVDEKKEFGTIGSSLSYYIPLRSFTLALRVGAASNIGDEYEFYQTNTLGSSSNLRGYRRTRFSGKSSVYQNAELRWKIENLHGYFFRGNYGLLAFVDNGRVWIPGEQSKTWHNGYGGGIWFLPYDKLAFTATFGVSEETQVVLLKAGFLF